MILAVLGAVIAVLVLIVGFGKPKQPAPAEVRTDDGLSGSPDQWRDAICMPGSLKNKSEHYPAAVRISKPITTGNSSNKLSSSTHAWAISDRLRFVQP